jgi:hypothetical protein
MRANSRSCRPTHSSFFHTSFAHNHTRVPITQCFQVKALISAGIAYPRPLHPNFAYAALCLILTNIKPKLCLILTDIKLQA